MNSGAATYTLTVALRKESVDRNPNCGVRSNWQSRSLSVRRAWIEISSNTSQIGDSNVALRKESVDRNMETMRTIAQNMRRSP